MAKLIYSMLKSMDGYTEDEHGAFGWGAPEEQELLSYINELASSFGTAFRSAALRSAACCGGPASGVAGGKFDRVETEPDRHDNSLVGGRLTGS